MFKRAVNTVRGAMLTLASDAALFLFVAFVSQTILSMGPLKWRQQAADQIYALIVVPWGGALCLLRLERRARRPAIAERADLGVLFVLLGWVSVPFIYRFGLTFNTTTCAFNHMVVFFGLYALTTEVSQARREHWLDEACALFAALGAALAVPTLWCVLTGQVLGEGVGEYPFGLVDIAQFTVLEFGLHYNTSGMVAQCCALFALAGACRRRRPVARALHLLSALAMFAAVALTQSRTARYALLGAVCVGAYGLLCARLPIRRALARHALALLGALAVFALGFAGAQALTRVTLDRYAAVRQARLSAEAPVQMVLADALTADQATQAEPPAAPIQGVAMQPAQADAAAVRDAFDTTFTGRTVIWRNLLSYWRENPKRLVIGNGMGNTGRHIAQGTELEADGGIAVHNTYLQFIADYGLIGFALMFAFLCMQMKPCLRALFAGRESARPGDRVLVMVVVCQLLTGLMESQPLGAMSATNLTLFFAFALLFARSRDEQAA